MCRASGHLFGHRNLRLVHDALLMRQLEKMDSASGRRALHFVAASRSASVHMGHAKVRGQF